MELRSNGSSTGAQTLSSLRQSLAYSAEAQGDAGGLYPLVLGRTANSSDLGYASSVLNSGQTQAQLRVALANSAEAASEIQTFFQGVVGRPATAAEVATWQGGLGTTWTQATMRASVAYLPDVANQLTAIIQQTLGRAPNAGEVGYWQYVLAGTGQPLTLTAAPSLQDVHNAIAASPEAQGDIGALYQAILGRAVDMSGLLSFEGQLANGLTQAQLRTKIADSPESQGDIANLYQQLFGRAASSDEIAGVMASLETGFTGDPTYTLSGVVNGAGQTFQATNASTALSELAVDVTLDSGVTPSLTDPTGRVINFADAAQLAAYLLGKALAAGTANPVLLAAYGLTVQWLSDVGQPLLQQGESELNAARDAKAHGYTAWEQAHEVRAQVLFDQASVATSQRGAAAFNSALGYADQVYANLNVNYTLAATFYETAARVQLAIGILPAGQSPDALLSAAVKFIASGQAAVIAGNNAGIQINNAAADVCLHEEAQAAGSRVKYTERVYEDHDVTVDVTVDPNASDPYGTATFHSKDQSGGLISLIEPILTAVLDLAAVISGNDWVLAVAAAVNAGESVQSFVQGNVLAGVLDLGAAAGFGSQSISAFAQAAQVSAGVTSATQIANAPTLLGTVAGTSKIATEILETTALVGGLSSIVNSAENGNGVGIIASTLEAAAAVAAGLVTTGAISDDAQIVSQVSIALGAASSVAAGANAIQQGHVADGLLQGLSALYSGIALDTSGISSQTGTLTSGIGDDQVSRQYAQVQQNYTVTDAGSAYNFQDPLVGYSVELQDSVTGQTAPSGIIKGVDSTGGVLLTNGAYYGSGWIKSITPIGGTAIAATTVSGNAAEIAALRTSAQFLNRISKPVVLVPDIGPILAIGAKTLSVLANAYALHLSLQTVTTGTLPGTNIMWVKDTKSDLLSLQHMSADGSPSGDFVALAIGIDGSLSTVDGEYVGTVNSDGGFTLSPVYLAEYNAHNVGYIGDSSTVYENRALNSNLVKSGLPKPTGLPDPSKNLPDPEGHHEVAVNDPRDQGLRNTLDTFHVDIDSAENGVWLSRQFHQRINTDAYHAWLQAQLRGVSSREDLVQRLSQIGKALSLKDAAFRANPGAGITFP